MKILIVDDEISIREWMAYIIERMDFGFEKILTAASGEEALLIFDAEQPEILFVDMLMPQMDGMTLIEYIRHKDMNVEIVILTSYSEFEFVRKALQYGVRDYVLKPEINREKIRELLLAICRRIDTRRKLMDENLDFSSMQKTAFVREVLCVQNPPEITRELLDGYNIPVMDRPLFAIAFKSYQRTEKFDIILPGHKSVEYVTGLVFNQNINLLLCNIRHHTSTLEQIYDVNEYIGKISKSNHFDIGVSRIFNGISQIPEAVGEAVFILKMTFYGVKATYEDYLKKNDSSTRLHRLLSEYQNKIKNVRLNKVPAFEVFQALIEALEALRSSDIPALKEGLAGLLFAMTDAPLRTTQENEQFQTVKRLIMEAATLEQVHKLVMEYLLNCGLEHPEGMGAYSRTISTAVGYIREHVSDDLSLKTVAQYVHLNADYFSRLFKKETGRNFVSFVEYVKLEQAAQLLRKTDMKVYEVAQKIGYSNVSYFSALFKKQYGVNPFTYRNNI